MPEQFSKLFIITAVVLGLLFLWVICIAITFWDLSRRELSGTEKAAWMALVVLIPGIGFAGYLFSRLLGGFFSPGRISSRQPARRMTMHKRQPEIVRRTGTIPAADLVRPTHPAVSPLAGNVRQQSEAVVKEWRPEFKLSVVDGPHTGMEYTLNSLPMRIGRGPEVSIRLDEDLGVSRLHAEIYEQAGVLRIRDLKSAHGTQVNDFSIEDKGLDPGDRIRVGLTTLQVRAKEGWR
jgi:hypothetical protein